MTLAELTLLREQCAACGGTGVRFVETDDGTVIEDCTCVVRIAEQHMLDLANIPPKYREFDFKDIDKEFGKRNRGQLQKVYAYAEAIDQQINGGLGLWFCSTPGLGKSILMVALLKAALHKGYRAFFVRASRLLTIDFRAMRSEEDYQLLQRILAVDILALEELDKIYLSGDEAMNNQLFYEILSDVYDSKKALLVSSNLAPPEVMAKFPTFIQDRLRSLEPIIFVGPSERRKKRV